MHPSDPRGRRRQPSVFLNHTPRSFEIVRPDCATSNTADGCTDCSNPHHSPPITPVSWAMSAAADPYETQNASTNLTSVSPGSPPGALPSPHLQDLVQKEKSAHVGMAAAAEMLYPQLPLNNPSFDMAYFLKNTGPPRRPSETPETPRGDTSKHKSPLKFLKGSGRRTASLNGSHSTQTSPPPVGVVQKTSRDGKQYLEIVPNRDVPSAHSPSITTLLHETTDGGELNELISSFTVFDERHDHPTTPSEKISMLEKCDSGSTHGPGDLKAAFEPTKQDGFASGKMKREVLSPINQDTWPSRHRSSSLPPLNVDNASNKSEGGGTLDTISSYRLEENANGGKESSKPPSNSSSAHKLERKPLASTLAGSIGPDPPTRNPLRLSGVNGNRRADSVMDRAVMQAADDSATVLAASHRKKREEKIRARKLRDLNRTKEAIEKGPSQSQESFKTVSTETTPRPPSLCIPEQRLTISSTRKLSPDYTTGYTPLTGQTLSPVMLVAEKVEVPRSRQANRPIPLLLKEYSPSKPAAVAVRATSPPRSPTSTGPATTIETAGTEAKAPNNPPTRAPSYRLRPVRDVRRLTGGSSTSGPSAVAQRSSICSSHTSASRETRLEARVEALERENKLLEAALMAVLKTSGTLNKCPCVLSKQNRIKEKRESVESAVTDGSGLSALDVYLSTRHGSGRV